MARSTDTIQNLSVDDYEMISHPGKMKEPMPQPDTLSTSQPSLRTGSLSENTSNSPGPSSSGLHRTLGNRQIQLIAVGGSIGTALFVTIGTTLAQSGPANLLLAFLAHNIILGCVNSCMAEMAVFMPVSGGFLRMASKWVDEAWGFMAGWNFFLYEALNIPFEITAIHSVLGFWRDDIPIAAVCGACIVLYGTLNILVVRIYGESEFWLSSGKVLLLFILFAFTFITMVGGNPHNDAYGFRYWQTPGAFAEYLHTGSLRRFEGFLAALWYAAFTCVGPEYISMIAGEAKHPRIYLKTAFKTAYWRFGAFFIGSAFCVGVVVAHNDPALMAVASGDDESSRSAGAASSPYVIAMENLGISVLPHIVNALLITSLFSAGNTYVYASSRSLYSLSLDGKAPKVLQKVTKNGVPIYCFATVMAFPFLSFLQLSRSSATVLSWLVNILSGAAVVNFIVMSSTYLAFYRACKRQGLDRSTLPYRGWFQPWAGYIAVTWMSSIALCYGYASFMPWNTAEFFTHYSMILLAVLNFCGWKVVKRSRMLQPEQVDLQWDGEEIDAYEAIATARDPPVGFWTEMFSFMQCPAQPRGQSVV